MLSYYRTSYPSAFAIVGTLSRYLEWDRLFLTFKLEVHTVYISSCTFLGYKMRRRMRVHYVYWMCLGVSVSERVGGCVRVWECESVRVWVCVSVCAVELGIQSGYWISVVTETRHWRLAASFPATLCNQSRPIWEDLIILERLVDISFDSTQRGEGGGEEEGRGGGQGVMCVWSVKWEVGMILLSKRTYY